MVQFQKLPENVLNLPNIIAKKLKSALNSKKTGHTGDENFVCTVLKYKYEAVVAPRWLV